MKKQKWEPYIRAMLAGFGAIGLSVAFFFVIYNLPGIAAWLDKIMDIMAAFVYGGVIAYLLRPMCNAYGDMLEKVLPEKMKKTANSIAVIMSMVTGLLIVYALIVMIAPQLVESIQTIWNAIPDRLDQFYNWAVALVGEEEELVEYLNRFNTGSDTLYAEAEKWITETLLPQIDSILGGVGSIVTGVGSGVIKVFNFALDLVIGIIVAVYLLGSRKRFARQSVMVVRSVFKPRTADLILEEVKFVDEMFGGFIDGTHRRCVTTEKDGTRTHTSGATTCVIPFHHSFSSDYLHYSNYSAVGQAFFKKISHSFCNSLHKIL